MAVCIYSCAWSRSLIYCPGEHLEHLKTTLDGLEETVKAQNLSAEEVIRMNTDCEALTRNLEDLKQKLEETRKTVMTLEVNVTNRAAAAEEALDMYTNMLSSLELFPPLPDPWQDVDLTLELNSASSNPHQLLTGSDIRKVIKPTLSGVAEMKRMERATVESELIKIENEHDQLLTECENMDCEIAEVEKKVVNLNEHADDLRDVGSSFNQRITFLWSDPRQLNRKHWLLAQKLRDWNGTSPMRERPR